VWVDHGAFPPGAHNAQISPNLVWTVAELRPTVDGACRWWQESSQTLPTSGSSRIEARNLKMVAAAGWYYVAAVTVGTAGPKNGPQQQCIWRIETMNTGLKNKLLMMAAAAGLAGFGACGSSEEAPAAEEPAAAETSGAEAAPAMPAPGEEAPAEAPAEGAAAGGEGSCGEGSCS
jgi:hypothetical protein